MANQSEGQERNLPPSERRRQKARNQGRIAWSRDFVSAIVLLVFVWTLDYTAVTLARLFGSEFNLAQNVVSLSFSADHIAQQTTRIALPIALAMLPLLGSLLIGSLVSGLMQTRGLFMPSERPFVDLDRINPASGAKRIFSSAGVFRLLVDLMKVGLIACLAGSYLLDHFGETQYFSKVPVSASFEIAINICKGLIYRIAGGLLVMGIVDYAVNYWRFEKSLRMTRDELKQEMREAEGDPAIKRRRRSFAQRVVQQISRKRINEASFVVTNPTHLAIAVRYDEALDEAPVVLAKGAGVFAKRIRKLAEEMKIPIIENKPLAQLLYRKARIDKPIPDETHKAVAEILIYLYRLAGKLPGVR